MKKLTVLVMVVVSLMLHVDAVGAGPVTASSPGFDRSPAAEPSVGVSVGDVIDGHRVVRVRENVERRVEDPRSGEFVTIDGTDITLVPVAEESSSRFSNYGCSVNQYQGNPYKSSWNGTTYGAGYFSYTRGSGCSSSEFVYNGLSRRRFGSWAGPTTYKTVQPGETWSVTLTKNCNGGSNTPWRTYMEGNYSSNKTLSCSGA